MLDLALHSFAMFSRPLRCQCLSESAVGSNPWVRRLVPCTVFRTLGLSRTMSCTTTCNGSVVLVGTRCYPLLLLFNGEWKKGHPRWSPLRIRWQQLRRASNEPLRWTTAGPHRCQRLNLIPNWIPWGYRYRHSSSNRLRITRAIIPASRPTAIMPVLIAPAVRPLHLMPAVYCPTFRSIPQTLPRTAVGVDLPRTPTVSGDGQ